MQGDGDINDKKFKQAVREEFGGSFHFLTKEHISKVTESLLKGKEAMTLGQKRRKYKNHSKAMKLRWKNASPEWLQEFKKRTSEQMKAYWANLTQEEREKIFKSRSEARKGKPSMWSKKSAKEKTKISKKLVLAAMKRRATRNAKG